MCHQDRKCSRTHETLTQDYESYYHPQFLDSTIGYRTWSHPPVLPLRLNSDPTNNPSSTYKPQAPDPFNLLDQTGEVDNQTAQMQSNNIHPFVPTGRQQSTMSRHAALTQFTDQQDVSSRPSLTPHLSHVSTPDSLFSLPYQTPNPTGRRRGIVTPSFAMTGEEDEEDTKPVQDVQLGTRIDADIDSRYDHMRPALHDWLSEPSRGHEWTNIPISQPVQEHQQPILYGQPEGFFNTSPRQFVKKEPTIFSPNQIYIDPSSETHPFMSNNVFEPALSRDRFTMPPVSSSLFNSNLGHFSASNGHSNISPQSYTYLAGFDYNNSPLYTTTPFPPTYLPYNLTQPQEGLPTQVDTVDFTGTQSNRGRINKANDLDEKLIKWRAEGLTYREIMKKGKWGLEESTLRGRYRTLTKDKEDRVRKPLWDHAALSALVASVDRLASRAANAPRTVEGLEKIPWKKVAEWMHKEKGCYLYGNATAKKKYKELVSDQQLQWEVNQWRRANGESPF